MLSFKVSAFCVLSCLIAISAAVPRGIAGGVTELSGDGLKDAETKLQNSLTKLAAGDGPNYKISKVHSATTQIVSGSLTKLKCDLEDSEGHIKKCDVSIWSQPWLENGIEVTFDCEGEDKVVKKHSA